MNRSSEAPLSEHPTIHGGGGATNGGSLTPVVGNEGGLHVSHLGVHSERTRAGVTGLDHSFVLHINHGLGINTSVLGGDHLALLNAVVTASLITFGGEHGHEEGILTVRFYASGAVVSGSLHVKKPGTKHNRS